MSLYGNDDCLRYFCDHCIQNHNCCQDVQCVAESPLILYTGDGSCDEEEESVEFLEGELSTLA